ncbi:MAG: GNAT family N-acetyltransferase [Prochlorotrichaceae cyanobacterium]
MHSSFSLDGIEFLPVVSRADCDRVQALAYKIWNQHYPPIIGQAQVDYMLDRFQSLEAIQAQMQQGMKYYLICYEGAAAGYFALERREKECFLSKLYIDKSLQRRGIGSRTIAFIQTLTNSLPLQLTVNKDNAGSLQFYQAQGFEIIDAVVNDIGQGFVMDDFVLERLPVYRTLEDSVSPKVVG